MSFKKFYLSFIALNVILISVFFFFPSNPVSLQIDDLYYKLNPHKASKKVVFVEIGEQAINKYGRWPWDREVLGKLLLKLKDAKAIALDMVFSEPTKKDMFLAQDLSQLPVVCGFFLRNNATQSISKEALNILLDSSIDAKGSFINGKYAEVNVLPILENCALNGAFSTLADEDNIYRNYVVALSYKGVVFPSLGLQTLRLYFNKDFPIKNSVLYYFDKKIKLDSKNRLKLNFYPLNSYQIVPIVDIDKFNFKDKIVIVGISELGVSDIRSTPIGQIPGPLLHYTFISNLLNNDYIVKNINIEILLIVLAVFLPLLIKNIHSISLRGILYVGGIFLFIGVGIVLYRNFNIMTDLFYPITYFLINILLVEYFLFKNEEAKQKFVKEAFKSYVSKELLEELLKNPDGLKLKGEEKEASVLFTDIRSFTTISENLKPEEVVKLVNSLFTPLSKIIIENKGMIDKYIGDAIMALFNAPLDVKDHANLACKSAVLMQKEISNISAQLKKEGFFEKLKKNGVSMEELRMGIGINTDRVFVGNLGSEMKFNYSALGDGVNLASRLESETKKLGVKILISENTYKNIDKNKFITEYKGEVTVKGKTKPVKVYALLGMDGVMI